LSMNRMQFAEMSPAHVVGDFLGLLLHWMLELGAWIFPSLHARHLRHPART
jgi:hypothetical protein